MIKLFSVYGNPNIGVYMYANNHFALVPPSLTEKDKKIISDVLDVDVVETKLADMVILGVLVAGNDRGLLVPRIVRPEEYDNLRESIGYKVAVEVLDIRATALGNLIVANNRAALVSPLVEASAVDTIKKVLGVEVILRRDLASIPTVGSMLVVTNKGGVVYPGVTEEESKILSNLFGVDVLTATVNFGVYFVKAGIVANDKGVLVGDETTGPELMRIQQALRLS